MGTVRRSLRLWASGRSLLRLVRQQSRWGRLLHVGANKIARLFEVLMEPAWSSSLWVKTISPAKLWRGLTRMGLAAL